MTGTLPGGGTVDIRYGEDGEALVLIEKGDATRDMTRLMLRSIQAFLVSARGTWSLGPGLPSLDESDVRAAIAYLDEHTETTP